MTSQQSKLPRQTTTVVASVKTGYDVAPSAVGLPSTQRLHHITRNILPYLHYGAERLGKSGIIGIALAVFSLFVFISANLPLHQQVSLQAEQLEQARVAGRSSQGHEAVPTPQLRASRFVAALPGRNDVPRVLGSVVAVAAATGIELEQGRYELVAGDAGGIDRYEMAIPVVGTYPQIRQFVENVLAREPGVTLDSMRLERSSVADTTVAADLRFSILLGGQNER